MAGWDRRTVPVLLFAGWIVTLWILAGVAALIALMLTRRSSLDRVYERLDLNGRDGRPANSKVMYTFGVFAGWVVVAVWGSVLVVTKQPLGAPFVTLVTLVLAASGGTDVLKSLFKARFGGLGDALQEHERQRPAAIAAAAEIRRRRTLGADDGVEPF